MTVSLINSVGGGCWHSGTRAETRGSRGRPGHKRIEREWGGRRGGKEGNEGSRGEWDGARRWGSAARRTDRTPTPELLPLTAAEKQWRQVWTEQIVDLTRFSSGNHAKLGPWRAMVGRQPEAICRLRGGENETSEPLRVRCPGSVCAGEIQGAVGARTFRVGWGASETDCAAQNYSEALRLKCTNKKQQSLMRAIIFVAVFVN